MNLLSYERPAGSPPKNITYFLSVFLHTHRGSLPEGVTKVVLRIVLLVYDKKGLVHIVVWIIIGDYREPKMFTSTKIVI